MMRAAEHTVLMGAVRKLPGRARIFSRLIKNQSGVTALETALLMPFIFIFLLYAIQIGFILLSHQITQYAAFMSARSYLVYGEKNLGEINYKYTSNQLGSGSGTGLYTNDNQSIAEATAEKIIF